MPHAGAGTLLRSVAELGAGESGQPAARHRSTREERGPAHRRRPAARARGRDPGRERRRSRGRRGRRAWPPGRSTGSASPTPGSGHGRRACGRSPRCPTRSARPSTAGPRPNGLQITRFRVPLGVIAIIYENRPNVTSDAAGLCVKAGNAALLRGAPPPCGRTSRSPRCCATRWPRTASPKTR